MGMGASLGVNYPLAHPHDAFGVTVDEFAQPTQWKDWTAADFDIVLDSFSWSPQMPEDIEDLSSDLHPVMSSLPIIGMSWRAARS